MNNSLQALHRFRTIEADQLYELLKSHALLKQESSEAVIHALVDISESVERVYGQIIPNMLNTSNVDNKELQDMLWDIREEFRHIEYHIEDAKLTEL